MTTTQVRNGQLITSTATEQDLEPIGLFPSAESTVTVICDVISGTPKFGVGPAGGSPVIDGDAGTYGSYSTTNAKAYRTLDPGIRNLRVVGVATFIISW